MKNSTDQNAKVYQKGTKKLPENINKYRKKIQTLNFYKTNTLDLYFTHNNDTITKIKLRKTIVKVESAQLKLFKKNQILMELSK